MPDQSIESASQQSSTTASQSPSSSGAIPARPDTMTIAERVRTARIAANKTQQQLAGDTYSKSYISAVERGKMTPSVQALGILADRLGLPMSYFLGESEIDLSALAESTASLRSTPERERLAREESLTLMLAEAEGLIRRHQPEVALEKLGGPDTLEELGVMQRPRWYWLAGWAAMERHQYHDALSVLERGLNLAENLRMQAPLSQKAQLAEMAERLRTFLGNAYFELGQPEMALEYHRRALSAINDGVVSDPDLKLRIYMALGHDYLQLGRYQEAMSFYEQATKQANDVDNLLSEGGIYWTLGLTYKDSGDLVRAKTNMQKALVALELQENIRLAAQLRALFGQVLVHLGKYADADANLRQSLAAAERTGDTATRGIVLSNVAAMHVAKGEHEQAIKTAREGLSVVKQSHDRRTEGQLHLTLADAHVAKGDHTAAEQALKDAISVFEQSNYRELIGRAHEKYGQFLADRGRFEEAYAHMHQARSSIARRSAES